MPMWSLVAILIFCFFGVYGLYEYLIGSHVVAMVATIVMIIASFVFVAMDGGPGKKVVVEKLIEFGVPFIDTGMGIYQRGDTLAGILRVTISTPDHHDHVLGEISFADDEEDDYEQNRFGLVNLRHSPL